MGKRFVSRLILMSLIYIGVGCGIVSIGHLGARLLTEHINKMAMHKANEESAAPHANHVDPYDTGNKTVMDINSYVFAGVPDAMASAVRLGQLRTVMYLAQRGLISPSRDLSGWDPDKLPQKYGPPAPVIVGHNFLVIGKRRVMHFQHGDLPLGGDNLNTVYPNVTLPQVYKAGSCTDSGNFTICRGPYQ